MEPLLLNAVIWIALVPLVLVFIILAYLVIGHYTPVRRTLDVFLLSLLSAVLLEVLALVLVQALLFLYDNAWPVELCRAYTWAGITFRFAELFTVVSLSIDRILLIKLKEKYIYQAQAQTKAIIIVLWISAGLIGVVMVAGWTSVQFYQQDTQTCTYLASDLHQRFAIFTAVLEVCGTVICAFCLADVWCHLKYFSNRTFFSTSQGTSSRVHMGLSDSRYESATQKALDASAAYDNCSICCLIVAIVLILNHLPYAGISLVGTLMTVSPVTLRVVSLWLVMVQALVLPHCMWLFNRRYRAALGHVADWFRCRVGFYTEERFVQSAKLHAYVRHNPKTSDLRTTTTNHIHDPLRRVARSQRVSSFHYESFLPAPTKSSSESNLAVFSHPNVDRVSMMERSRSLEAHLDHEAFTRSHGPSIGARNVQLNEVIIHDGEDELELIVDFGDEDSNGAQGSLHRSSVISVNGNNQVSQRSVSSSGSSTQSPKAKRRRMMSQPSLDTVHSEGSGSAVDNAETDSVISRDTRVSQGSGYHNNAHTNSYDSRTDSQPSTPIVKKNKVLRKKSSVMNGRNSVGDVDYSSESDSSTHSKSSTQTLKYGDDDIDAVLGVTEAAETHVDIVPQYFEQVPNVVHLSNTKEKPRVNVPAVNQDWDDIHRFDNHIEEITVSDGDIIVAERDSEYIDEFSTSEFDETSLDDLDLTDAKLRKQEKTGKTVNDLYPMYLNPSKSDTASKWSDDGTNTILRRPPAPIPLQNGPPPKSDNSVQKATVWKPADNKSSKESTENDNKPDKFANRRRLSSFGKPLPVKNDTSEEDLAFSTDNPVYVTLSRKQRFEQSKQEIQRVISLNETQTDDITASRDKANPRLNTRLNNNAPMENIHSQESNVEREIIYLPLQSTLAKRDNRKDELWNDMPNNVHSASIPQNTKPSISTFNKHPNGTTIKPYSQSSKAIPSAKHNGLPSTYNQTTPQNNVSVSKTHPQKQSVGSSKSSEDQSQSKIQNSGTSTDSLSRENTDMDRFINSRGRGKVLGHYGAMV